MGILDSVIGSLLGGNNAGSSGIGGVLSSLLGGGSGSQGMAGGQGVGGGIGGIVSQFERAGLGGIAQSWVGNGPNQSVSPQQLQNVFGDQVPGMASQAGMNQGDFLSQLSQHLPSAINGMTPNGQVASDGSVDV